MARTIAKGNLGVAKILADLVEKGMNVSVPISEDSRYDLIADSGEKLLRVQCKYVESDGAVICVRPWSVTHVSFEATKRYKYTAEDIDLLAVYDVTTDTCFYIPAEELGEGKRELRLRIAPTRNGQEKGVRWAKEYLGL